MLSTGRKRVKVAKSLTMLLVTSRGACMAAQLGMGKGYLFLFVPYRDLNEFSETIGDNHVWGFQVSPGEVYDPWQREMQTKNRPRAPRCLPSFYRGESIIGACQTCSIHQLTVWPSVLCADCI